MVSAATSQSEGHGFNSRLGAFLRGACMLSSLLPQSKDMHARGQSHLAPPPPVQLRAAGARGDIVGQPAASSKWVCLRDGWVAQESAGFIYLAEGCACVVGWMRGVACFQLFARLLCRQSTFICTLRNATQTHLKELRRTEQKPAQPPGQAGRHSGQ